MNLEIFKVPDPSGRMSKESFIFKNYKEEYDYIIEYCHSNGIFDISFKEKVYIVVNNLLKIPICKNQNCNKRVSYKNSTLGYKEYCSTKCVSSDPNIKQIKVDKSIEKFGTKTPGESLIVKEKMMRTNMERYGYASAMCLDETQKRSKKTLMKNHGVDNPAKSSYLLSKRVESFKENIDVWKESFKKTSMERYGVDNPWKDIEIHNKSVESTKKTKNTLIESKIKEKIKNIIQYTLISIDFNKFKRELIIHCSKCGNEFKINREDFHIRYKNKTTVCMICNPINSSKSGSELELQMYIKSIYDGELISNKKIIYPMEVDIYLPDKKIGFEFNGLYWHSESQKGKYYHVEKTKKCKDLEIDLVHIWEDDWVYKNEIIRSIVLDKLGLINNKIWARKCELIIVKNNISKDFLNENHILGSCSSSIKIGLIFEDRLVSIMCFNKKGKGFELCRFCNLVNHSVVGGASKMFSFFVKNYNPKYIISYSDNSMFSGIIYEKLGFTHVSDSKINYKWVIGKKREHKSNYRKDRLVKSGYDIKKSEDDIMIEDVGSYKIWDCGLKKWIWNNNIYSNEIFKEI